MDDEERPRPRPSEHRFGAASLLSQESLDRYSLDELDGRKALLEDEISRIAEHRNKAAAHRLAADALFGKTPGHSSGSSVAPPDPFADPFKAQSS